MLYCVKGGLVEDVVAEGMDISGREPIFAVLFAFNITVLSDLFEHISVHNVIVCFRLGSRA